MVRGKKLKQNLKKIKEYDVFPKYFCHTYEGSKNDIYIS